MLVIPALRRLRQEDQEFKVNLDYVRPCLQTQPKGTWRLHFTPGIHPRLYPRKYQRLVRMWGPLYTVECKPVQVPEQTIWGFLNNKTKQNKTKQNKSKQNKTKQNKTGTRITMWFICASQDLSKGIKGNIACLPRGSSLELPQIIRSKPTVGSSSPSSV